ncbi:chondroitin sulfate proteoglycan 4 [Brachyhypopomus gauderio]|uniref:chondroitin sulfate proteoglycan 4 n=1 Tax=Brachyhypopomus gauderio TaxID=698409 RepID=UPI004042C3D0
MKTLFLYGLLSLLVGIAEGASFYGDGYVHLKTVEISGHNTLRMRFRTSSQRGVLFLAAGQTDYLLLELSSGQLQVRLDLGSGERILRSDRRTPLNDFAWHTVEFLHDRHNVTFTVDKHFQTTQKLPSRQQELSIKDGLYVGGAGGLDKVYLPSDLIGFRGCLEEVVFNQHNLLSSLRSYSGLKNVYEVSLGCSPQFFANEDDPISFFSSRAYVSLPTWSAQHEWLFECSVHTSAKEGIIMFSSARQGDFVTMEIQEGLLAAVVGRDGVKTELRSLTFINDKKWHYVKLYFTSKTLQLTVDTETVKSSIISKSKALQLKGFLFLGGVDDSTRAEVKKVGLASVAGKRIKGGSFKGCFRNVKVNGVSTGLPNAVVTKDISIGCEPEKDLEMSTTTGPATVSGTFLGTVTELPPIDMSTLAQGLVKKYGQNFVQLRDLVVPEGGRGSLDSKHIKVNLDFKKLGIRQSQITFRIEEQPVHGQLRFDLDQEQEENTFSMLDLWHSRVMYIHGGSEDPHDHFMFSVFSSSRKETPSYLKGHKLYRFNITVTPTNDAPELSLPEGNLFVLLENSRKKLSTNVLKATDVDSSFADLGYSVLGNLNADAGFLETEDNPGQSVSSFPHSALVAGKINYVHTGVRNSRIALRVSDGEKVSNTVVLRIMAVGLVYTVANNTGLEVTQGEMGIISTNQLAVQTNAVRQVVDVRYDVIDPPRFGELQRLHSDGEWKLTNYFSQKVLEKARLRYLSTFKAVQSGNINDHFKCKVTIASKSTEQLVFTIKIKWINYTIERNEMVEMDKIRRITIDPQHLYATANGVNVTEDELYFRLLSSPNKGILLLNKQELEENSSFSQMDITNMKVEYQLVDRPTEDTSDNFEFQVFTKYAHSTNHIFTINIKADINSIFIKNKGLSLLEGESKLITKDELFAETLSTKEMYYTVTKSPKNGKLARINLSNSSKEFDKLVSFTYQDILEERLMYVHDNSETTHDQFSFIASTSPLAKISVNEDEVGSKEGLFNISIQLLNDEKPVRTVDKVFHVVRDGQKLLTVDDLCYHDGDSDFSDGQLIYTRRGIPVGDLVLVNDTSHKLYQFRQEDLEQKRVLFIHRGASSGRFVFFVSDGKHYVSSLLDISTQDPYLKVANNTGLLVQKGHAKTFSNANFSVISNLDIREDSEITFEIHDGPKHGGLFLKDKKIDFFNQHMLKNMLLSYRHDDSKTLGDFFSVLVKAKGLHLEAKISVKVYLEKHQRPPAIFHHKPLLVEEGKPVKIEHTTLEVTHEANIPSEIIFSVKVAPTYGYLRVFVDGEDRYQGTEEKPLVAFTQQDINAGNIQYVQIMPNQVNDSFILEASNGVAEVSDIILYVDIIPHFIPVEVSNITLKEGAAKALTENTIRVSSQHFAGLHFVYFVSEGPIHGRIENSRFPGIPTTYFTRKQVEQEFIYYVHDNSETLEDHFTITANDTNLRKYSAPRTVYVQVIPVNDEPPVVTANKVLRVWVGSITQITQEDMNAEDEDSEPEELRYITTQPSNGHLALKSAPTRPIMDFTQADIDQGQLLFVHSGAMAGGFHFQVNDGVNFTSRQIFSVTARALVLHLEKSGPLKVFPGSLTSISKEVLRAVTNDDKRGSNRTILFTVINPPTFGKLMNVKAADPKTEITSFTQKMVDQGEVAYEQNVNSVEWVLLDKFTFTASSPPASLEDQTFDIHISYENAEPERQSVLLKNTGAVVMEGHNIVIDKAMLDASNLLTKQPEPRRHSYEVWYQVESLPQHGVIVVGERNLTKEKSFFSQFILNKYGITYQHDDSETLHDHFVFNAFLNLKSKPAQLPADDREVVEEVFNITISPVNDQPPVLKTKAPSLKVVQGDVVALGPSHLNVVDLDNPPDQIQYTVISRPSNGYLALAGNLNVSADAFSQAQINNGEVVFVQDGSPMSGVFYFSVTDGQHRPVYKLFNLEVLEIAISLISHTEVVLEQGQTTVVLNESHLTAVTNGKNTTVHYKITSPPRYGKLLLDNEEVSAFDQGDLQTLRLSYHMVNLVSSQDNFEFTAFTSETNLTDQVVNITVKPLIRYGESVQIPNGIRSKLRADYLNVSELALMSGSDPLFEVLSPPMFGKILYIEPNKGNDAEDVRAFVFSELQQEKLAIEVKANLTGVQVVNDSFRFIVKADNLQPANGEFFFTIVPLDSALMITALPSYTSSPVSSGLTTVIGSGLPSTSSLVQISQQVTKAVPKFKGRSRWGSSNHGNTNASTIPKTTRGQEIIPVGHTPVRVESAPRGSSTNPMIIVLPLLALLLLVIVVVLVLLLRRNQQKKQKPVMGASVTPASPNSRSHQGHSERNTKVPLVTVTPLSPSNPGSPALTKLRTGSGNTAYGPSMALCTLDTLEFCSTTKPTLQHNQYWV